MNNPTNPRRAGRRAGLAVAAVKSSTVKVIDLYCRISVDYDGTLRSVKSQEDDMRDEIEDAHPEWVVGKVWRDHAKSAWRPSVIRPQFEAMMQRLENGECDGVMVYDLTRFSRKPIEGERLIAIAERGIVVSSLTIRYDLTNPHDIKAFRNACADAAHESNMISHRSARGKRKKAKRGLSNATTRGFARPGYLPQSKKDREKGKARVPVSPEQLAREVAAVRDVVARILAGESMGRLAEEWNDAGLFTVKGKRWTPADLRQMLESPAMAGLVEYKGEIMGSVDGEPPIDPKTWDHLMSFFMSRKRGRQVTKYLGSNLLVCGKCGETLFGRPQPGKPYDDGSPRRIYFCMYRPKTNTGCRGIAIDQRTTDEVVRAMVVDRLQDKRHAKGVAKTAAKVAVNHAAIMDELARLNTEADNVASKTGKPGWTPARVDAALVNYAELIEDAEARLAALGDMPTGDDADRYADAEAAWDAFAADDNMDALRNLVRKAFPDGIVVLPATSRGRGVIGKTAERIAPGPWVAPAMAG